MKSRLAFSLWVLFWIVIGLVALEMLLRARPGPIAFRAVDTEFVFDDRTLFRFKPDVAGFTDSNGYRLTPGSEAAAGRPQILLAGDSFAQGVNVGNEQTTAAHLQALFGNRCQVINMGVYGYGPDQSLALWRQGHGIDQPAAVVLTVFPANDFNDLYKNDLFVTHDMGGPLLANEHHVLHRNMPRLRVVVAMSFLASRFTSIQWLANIDTACFGDSYDIDMLGSQRLGASPLKAALMRGVLRTFRDEVRQRGARFAVIILPSFEQMVDPQMFIDAGFERPRWFVLEDMVEQMCGAESIEVVNMVPIIGSLDDPAAVFDHQDHHLNPRGYKLVADEIYKLLGGDAM